MEENENMFEIQRLENLKIMSGEVPLTALNVPLIYALCNRRSATGLRRAGGFQATHFV